jgi:hypothetical protein
MDEPICTTASSSGVAGNVWPPGFPATGFPDTAASSSVVVGSGWERLATGIPGHENSGVLTWSPQECRRPWRTSEPLPQLLSLFCTPRKEHGHTREFYILSGQALHCTVLCALRNMRLTEPLADRARLRVPCVSDLQATTRMSVSPPATQGYTTRCMWISIMIQAQGIPMTHMHTHCRVSQWQHYTESVMSDTSTECR